jgi:hypothetical protein
MSAPIWPHRQGPAEAGGSLSSDAVEGDLHVAGVGKGQIERIVDLAG